MRKYRTEQVMRWLDLRDGWKLQKQMRKLAKYLIKADEFKKRKDDD